MPLISFLLFILALTYFFTALYLLSHPQPPKNQAKNLPGVAVLIAMRNEQETIAECLTSLAKQEYPDALYDVFILDDRSTDDSPRLARTFVRQYENFHLLKINEDKNGLQGKMNALAQGLEKVRREWVLITDADCIVPPQWIRSFSGYFDRQVALVGGLTLLEPPPNCNVPQPPKHLFGKIQALDWLFLQTIAAASSNADKPISVLGNNFAFRMQAYRQVGGFKALGFSVTEDFALMRAIEKSGQWKILHTLDPDNAIFSYPVKTLKAFFEQRWRWISGGRGASPWSYFLVGLSSLAHFLMLLIFVLGQWNLGAATGIGLLLGMDYFIVNRSLRRFKMHKLKKYFGGFEIFYALYLLFFSVFYFFPKKVNWKGRQLFL